jgi:hypothetical protein
MLASLIIVFREVFEAGLIVGIILAATRGVPRRGIFIAGGSRASPARCRTRSPAAARRCSTPRSWRSPS